MNTWGEGRALQAQVKYLTLLRMLPHIIENATKDQRWIHAVKGL